MNKCFLTELDLAYDFRINPNRFSHELIYYVDFYGVEKNMWICCPFPGFRLNIRDNEVYRDEIKSDITKQYLLHFLFEASKLEFEPLFANVLHFRCDRNHKEGHLSIKPFIDNLYSELPPIPNREKKKKMLIQAIYEEQDYDFSEISIANNFKFRAKSYMRDSKELNSYLEDLQEQKLIKIENKYIKFTGKGLEFIENGFKPMAHNNSNSVNGNNNTVIQVGSGSKVKIAQQQQNVGNTFSQENKNDIKEIIQFLKENVENLNLSNDDVTDIKNEVQILESQINRESPKKERINSALGIIQSMLTSITANLYTPKVEAIVNKIGGLIGNVPIG